MLYRAEYAIHVRFHTSFRDQKGKNDLFGKHQEIFHPLSLWRKNRLFILGGYI